MSTSISFKRNYVRNWFCFLLLLPFILLNALMVTVASWYGVEWLLMLFIYGVLFSFYTVKSTANVRLQGADLSFVMKIRVSGGGKVSVYNQKKRIYTSKLKVGENTLDSPFGKFNLNNNAGKGQATVEVLSVNILNIS